MNSVAPKRVLIFSLAYYPRFVAGVEVAIKEITDRTLPQKAEFDMITAKLVPDLPRFEKIGNVSVYRVGFGSPLDKVFFPLLGTIKAIGLLFKNSYNFFWVMMVTYSSGVPYIVNILRKIVGKKKIPVILTLQEGDSEEYIRKKKFGLAGFIWKIIMFPVTIFLPSQFRKLGLIGISWALALKRTDRLTVISAYLKDQALKFGYTGPIYVVPNGVDFDLFSKPISEQEATMLKEKIGIKKGDTLLITTSRLVEKNAIGDVIDALLLLPTSVKFLILGEGVQENMLKDKVRSLKFENRVQFLGYIIHKEMLQYLHISDIFIRPSLSEGFGISFIEAMAADLPVITTPVGGIPDFLRDGETGLFCEPSNPQSIAQKVEKLIKDNESREYIVRQARDMVKKQYDWRLITSEMGKVFDTI